MASGDNIPKAEVRVHFDAKTGSNTVDVEIHTKSKEDHKPVHKSRKMPFLFERAGSWWPNPKFDSEILEKEQWESYFPQTRRRFQYALFYILIACIAWVIFFATIQTKNMVYFLIGTLVLLVIIALLLGFTYTKHYKKYYLPTSFVVTLLVCLGILLPYIFDNTDLSTVGTFTATVELLLMMYSVIPMPLFVTVIIGLSYSLVFEFLTAYKHDYMRQSYFIIGKVLLHLCIHLMGLHIFTMKQVQQRSTFWKIGQSILAQNDLQFEKQIKEKMIHSLMPPKVANEVMKSREGKDDEMDDVRTRKRGSRSKARAKGEIIFRPFNMNTMNDVSILFADIVGFTKMSSNKTAEHLVALLNDLFGRFDKLCENCGCEKISTLGDCYYCVSGCPEPRQGHARCCVEMGLGMIKAIEEFDRDHNEQVNMRVGVHTGTVLCGIVGTRRFKFDVWSNDVSLANTMESSGQPGRVHLSEATYEFLKDEYEVEDGPLVKDNRTTKVLVEHYDKVTSTYAVKHEQAQRNIKTYFIIGRKRKDDDQSKAAASNGEAPVHPDSMAISMDNPETLIRNPTESDNLMKDAGAVEGEESASKEDPLLNHYEPKSSDANGVSPATLLTRRHSSGFYAASELSLDRIGEGKKISLSTNPPAPNFPTDTSTSTSAASPTATQLVILSPDTMAKIPSSVTLVSYHKLYGINNNHNVFSKGCNPELPHSQNYCSNNLGNPLDAKMNNNPQSPILNGNKGNNSCGFEVDDTLDTGAQPISETLNKYRNAHQQTDMQIVTCVREGIEKKEYFYKPPINNITLAFLDSEMEENYRDHYLDETHIQNTLSAPKYHAFMEFLLSFLVFAIISIFCFIVFGSRLPWILVFIVSLILEVINLVRSVATIKWHNSEEQGFCWKVSHVTAGWYLRNILGAITVSLPIIAVYSNFSCDLMTYSAWTDRFFCFCIMVSVLHYTNFTTLSSWVKTVLAGIAGIVLIILLTLKVCASKDALAVTTASVSSVVLLNSTTEMMITSTTDNTTASNLSKEVYVFSVIHNLQFEIIVDMLLLLLLIGFLNRESEISYRLNFQGDAQAWNVKQQMQENKDQADWLLHNIIPEHVSDKVRKTSKYSKNHKDVGVIFAAIVNFNEIYDESYEGGREFLRVLNELVSDYEELLDDPRFKDVEKIKTISSTFMAASGLNEQSRAQNKHPYSHLYSLMEFSIEMQNAVKRFNESIFNFAFILNIGYNYGEVTAGVIGTTKLLYDIWGDTVNIASRMYSTGVKERIQVPEATAKLLEDKFEFEYRGEISVKGKGEMLTYLLVKKIEGATWD